MSIPLFLLLLPPATAPAMVPAALPAWSVFEQPADPAATLERQARRALATGDNRDAARLYRELRTSYPRSSFSADAYYWEAFALYRLGGESDLRRALDALAEQGSKWPKAPSREDAVALETRVQGALARYGDATSTRLIVGKAERAERPERPERPEQPERMERPERPERPEFPNRATAGGRSSGPSTPEGCSQEDDDARVEALNALMQMDADRALPVLEKVMARRDRCSVLLRRKAVFLVSQKRSTDGTALLIDAIKNDPDSEVREQAVFWLGQSGGEDAVTVLADLVRIARNEDVRKKAVFALAQTRSPRASAALRDLVNDEKAPVELRKDGIFWLGQMSGRSTETVTLLSGLYGTIRQDELKDQILFAMSQQRSPAAAAFLRRVAGDDAEQMERRESAIFWFGQSTGTSDELMAIYRAEKAVAVKDKIIFALSQHRRDPKAVDHLLSIAKTESNRELRKSAIFWLSQSKDARVAQFLQELIDK